ncbi:MAG: GntP family permease [Fusobacteriaceae bacterium]|jgi:H+/gluconate symporter-like permease|nr:GntP family permease [Fusobacteriaceae bacterium]
MISLIGIILALGLLIYFAFKGKSLIWAAPICVFVVAIFSKINPLSAYTSEYMKGFTDFILSWLPVFMLSTIFGMVMEVTNIAASISYAICGKIGQKHAILIVALSSYILTYGGVNCWVVIFTVFPIATALFREADIPRRLMPATIAAGTFTSAMTTIVGTPQIHNLMPIKYFGTTPMAAPKIGIICAIIEFGGALLWLTYRSKKLKAKGEHYTEINPSKTNGDNNDNINIDNKLEKEKLPNPILSLVPFAALLISLNLFKINIIISILIGIFLAIILNLKKCNQIINSLNDSSLNSIKAIVNTASVVGFGFVVKFTAGFALLRTLVTSINGDPLLVETISINILAAASGSASGGLQIALDSLGDVFLKNGVAAGYSPQVLHRIAAMSSGCLNTMPHDGAVVTFLAYCGVTHREGFYDIFWVNGVAPSFALIIGLIMAMNGVV